MGNYVYDIARGRAKESQMSLDPENESPMRTHEPACGEKKPHPAHRFGRLTEMHDRWCKGVSVEVMVDPFQPGEWVLVWAQVTDPEDQDTKRNVHPEDVLVTLFSHSEEYTADVVRKHIKETTEQPEFALRCSLMCLRTGSIYLRCDRHEGHGGAHQAVGTTDEIVVWPDTDTAGYIEES